MWTAVLRQASGKATGRLVAIAHSASGPLSLLPLLRRLPASIEVVGVTLPGRERRIAESTEELRADPDKAVEAVLREIRGYPALPTVLFGHSMGAAFATAAVLTEPELFRGLVVSGHAGRASTTDVLPPHRTENDLLRILHEGGGTPVDLLADSVTRAHLLELLQCDLSLGHQLAARHDGRRIPVPLTVLGGRQDALVPAADLRHWAARSPFEVRQRLFAGGHFYLLDEANRDDVAAEIAAAFDPARAGTPAAAPASGQAAFVTAPPSSRTCTTTTQCPPVRRSRRLPAELTAELGADLDELLLSALLIVALRYTGTDRFGIGVRRAGWASPAHTAMFGGELPGHRSVRRHRDDVAAFLATLAPPTGPPATAPAVAYVAGGPAGDEAGTDLVVSAETTASGVVLHVDLHDHVHDRDAGDRLLGHLTTVLTQLAGDGDAVTGELEMLTAAEYAQWRRFNETARPYPRAATIWQLFLAQAESAPHRPAVVHDSGTLTYRQLAERAEVLAGVLAARGCGRGDRIAVQLDRTPDLIATILAILRLGAAYVPLDTVMPPARRDFMLSDSAAVALIVDNATASAPVDVVDITGLSDPAGAPPSPRGTATPQDEAYVMYTSGTQGRPKGVPIDNRAVVRLVRGTDFVDLGPATRMLQTGAIAFDATTFEIWGPLLNGGAVVLVPADTVLEANRLGPAMTRHGVNTLWLTSPLFNQLVEQEPGLFAGCQVVVGGEALSPQHVARAVRACPDAVFVNGYGPTENTTFSLTHRITGAPAGRVPIGRPIANSTAWILDRDGRLQPVGVPGELCVGGDGLSSGYLNQPELTAAAFGQRSFDGKRLYRTGDIACRRSDGLIDYLGRADDQIKIRGFRVELSEIESQLRSIAGVREAAVVLRHRGGTVAVLAAYYTGATTLTGEAVRAALLDRLPEYMVPTEYLRMDALPLTGNHKVDRTALGKLEPVDCTTATTGARRPSTELESTVARVFADVLGLTTVSLDDDFFALGGHSLLAMRLWTSLRSALGVELQLVQVMDNPTVSGLVGMLARQPAATRSRPRLARRTT